MTASPMPDLPLPPALAVEDEPLSEADLAELDTAFAIADAMGRVLLLDGVVDPDAGQPNVPDVVRHWEIEDDGAAEWALRHVAQIDSDLQRGALQRDEWQARIDHWYDQASAVALRRRSFFEAHLVAYATERREANPKAPKTLSLPSGQIISSDQQAKVKVTDDDALALWLADHGLTVGPDGADVAVTTTKVYAAPLRKVLKPAGDGVVIVATGELVAELPAGLAVEPAHTSYAVRPVL